MSYGLYVGRNLTATGHAYLAGYGDEPSSHWLEIIEERQHPAGATITVGVTPEAELPGVLSEIPQAASTARHVRVCYSHYKGVPAPLSNGGLNEYGVAVRDIWSTSRADLIAMTPGDQRGPNYSDLAKLVLERARTAKEGVELIGQLIAIHGYSTYGGNSHIIADANEAWVVIEFAGGIKLWVAERLGDDTIRASRPGHIGEIPPAPDDNFLFPDHFIDFAIDQGWHTKGKRFNVNGIYGDDRGAWEGARWIEAEMGRRAQRPEKITLEDMFWAIRTPRLTGDTAGYGQVVPLVEPSHSALRMIWHAPVGAVAAPFMPVFLGMTEIAEEYRQHRYLSSGEHARFMDMRHALGGRLDTVSIVPQGIEASRSAVAICKRLFYLALRDAEASMPELERIFVAHERRLMGLAGNMQEASGVLIDAGRHDLAVALITYFANCELRAGLRLAEQLADGLDARTRAFGGFDTSPEPRSCSQIW
ncbi:MAG: peptidase dipeptidase [Rhizobium sp.]|nr:peptidase dipeptidase [Rhizobium sp.]